MLEPLALARAEEGAGGERECTRGPGSDPRDERGEHYAGRGPREGLSPGVRETPGPVGQRRVREQPPVDGERHEPADHGPERQHEDRRDEPEHDVEPDPAEVAPGLRIHSEHPQTREDAGAFRPPVHAGHGLAEKERRPPTVDRAEPPVHVGERREDRDADQRHEQREPSRQPGDLHAEADDRGHAAEEDERELAPGLEAQRAEEDPRHGESLGRRVAAHGAASRRPR
jgi:hypothetical protein